MKLLGMGKTEYKKRIWNHNANLYTILTDVCDGRHGCLQFDIIFL